MNSARELKIPAIPVEQPIGTFYLASIPAHELVEMASADLRRMESELDRYVGIQRQLNPARVTEIGKFVNSVDATFPTSVVLSIRGDCASFDPKLGVLTLKEGQDEETGNYVEWDRIANILDGQHRVEGLKSFAGETFAVPVSIFVDADIADQAYIFATVNLAQTKVNKSLVYDLLDYAKARSPQRSAHDIVVALDGYPKSPLFEKIKRLGTATPGRDGTETLAQATVVNSLLPLISKDPETDRFDLAKGKKVSAELSSYAATPLRYLWVEEKDTTIAKILFEYFSAVRNRWPDAWGSMQKGAILTRTNGFRALMKFFRLVYLKERRQADPDRPVVKSESYAKYFERVELEDDDFNSNKFLPGTSGETQLFNKLREDAIG